MNKKQWTNLLIGFGIGLIIGGITAILTTPTSGKKLRIKIHDTFGELKTASHRALHPEKYSRIKS